MAVINVPAHVLLGTGETEVVTEVADGGFQRVYITLVNNNIAARTVRLYRYDAGASETAGIENAYLYDYTLAGNSADILELSFTLAPGWKVGALASSAASVVCHVDTIQV